MPMSDHEQIRLIMKEEIERALKPTNDKVNEMYSIFANAKGFGDIAVTLLKSLILLGAGIAVIVGFIKFLKQ